MTTWRVLSATQPPHLSAAMPRREFGAMANDRDPETNPAAFLGAELRRARLPLLGRLSGQYGESPERLPSHLTA